MSFVLTYYGDDANPFVDEYCDACGEFKRTRHDCPQPVAGVREPTDDAYHLPE